MIAKLISLLCVLPLALAAACTTTPNFEPDITGVNYEHILVPPTANPLASAEEAFRRGNFSHAARYYEMALARNPTNRTALIGLAASYDLLWRFDLAKPVYQRATLIAGDTAMLLNNRGYSYLLQGDFGQAKRFLELARRQAPNDPVIAGNLRLLEEINRQMTMPSPNSG